jgi:hypothetical protein
MYHDVEAGAEFFFDENDYISKNEVGKESSVVKMEATSTSISTSSRSRAKLDSYSPLAPRGKKRPRRAATTIRSYAVPDSDDDSMEFSAQEREKKPEIEESNLKKWVKHLGILVKEEQRKVRLCPEGQVVVLYLSLRSIRNTRSSLKLLQSQAPKFALLR